MAKRILAEKSGKVLAYLQEHDTGDGISIKEIADAMGLEEKNIRPVVTLSLAAKKDGSRGALVLYEKREVEGEEKTVGYAVLTDEGREFVDETEEEE